MVFFSQSQVFRVEEVICQEEFISCPQEVIDRLELLVGRNIFFLEEEDFESQILAQTPEVASLKFSRRLPDRVLVLIELRRGVNALANYSPAAFSFDFLTATISANVKFPSKSHPGYFLLDNQAKIFALAQNSPLPKVLLPDDYPLVVGQIISDPGVNATAKIARLALMSENPVVLGPKGLIYTVLQEGILAIFSDKKDPATQVATLQLIVARARIESKIPQRVDLRFDKPVVSY